MSVINVKPKNTIERNAGNFQSNATTWSSSTTTWSDSTVTWGGFYGISDVGPTNAKVVNVKPKI